MVAPSQSAKARDERKRLKSDNAGHEIVTTAASRQGFVPHHYQAEGEAQTRLKAEADVKQEHGVLVKSEDTEAAETKQTREVEAATQGAGGYTFTSNIAAADRPDEINGQGAKRKRAPSESEDQSLEAPKYHQSQAESPESRLGLVDGEYWSKDDLLYYASTRLYSEMAVDAWTRQLDLSGESSAEYGAITGRFWTKDEVMDYASVRIPSEAAACKWTRLLHWPTGADEIAKFVPPYGPDGP